MTRDIFKVEKDVIICKIIAQFGRKQLIETCMKLFQKIQVFDFPQNENI